ncbi:MAG: hypothetical protein K2N85_07855 [Lachnospiraceae bacterium]|nr:hypothetical protein [Lachnospiraceae bacterium]
MEFKPEVAMDNDKDIYNRIGYFSERFADSNRWFVNESRDVYCIDKGKRGPETPEFYNMLYHGHLVQFFVYEENPCPNKPEWLKNVCYFFETPLKDSESEVVETIKDFFNSKDVGWHGCHEVDELIFNFEEKRLF